MRISDWSSDVCSSDLVGVRQHRTHAHGAGLAVDAVLGEVQLALEAAVALVAQAHLHRHVSRALLERQVARPRVARIGEEGALVDIEVEVDRIERDETRQAGPELGQESCRERVGQVVSIWVVARALNNKKKKN